MNQKEIEELILSEAEAIKKRRADIDASTEELRLAKLSFGEKLIRFWDTKVVTTFWITFAIWFLLSIFGLVPKI